MSMPAHAAMTPTGFDAGSEFSLLELSPVWWLDPSIGMYSDAGTTPAVNDSAVQQADDQSGNERTFSQGTESNRPVLKTHILNGHPVLRFDGSSDLLLGSSVFLTATQGLVAAVVIPRAVSSMRVFLSSSDEGGIARSIEFRFPNTGNKAAVRQRNNDTADSVSGDSTISVDTPYIVMFSSSGTAYSVRINGVDQTLSVDAGSNTGDWFGDTDLRDNIALGALKQSSTSSYFNGDIAEIAVFSQDKTLAEKQQIESHWSDKFGISI